MMQAHRMLAAVRCRLTELLHRAHEMAKLVDSFDPANLSALQWARLLIDVDELTEWVERCGTGSNPSSPGSGK
jgi:hypothetical protein